ARVARYLAPIALALGLTYCKDQGPDITPASVALTPSAATSIPSGTTLPLTAAVFNAGGGAINQQTLTWSSSDRSIADVSASGVVTGIHTGTAQITATAGTVQSPSVVVTVTPGAASQLAIRAQPAGAASGAALATQPVVEIRDAAGNLVTSSTAVVTATIATG